MFVTVSVSMCVHVHVSFFHLCSIWEDLEKLTYFWDQTVSLASKPLGHKHNLYLFIWNIKLEVIIIYIYEALELAAFNLVLTCALWWRMAWAGAFWALAGEM